MERRVLVGSVLVGGELGLGLLGRQRHSGGLLGRPEPRQRLVADNAGNEVPALDAGAIEESELAAVLAGSTGSVTACRYPGSPVRGKPIECSPNGGCPCARPLLRSAVGFASAAPVRSVAKENLR
jgi:hypothetical protein